MDGCIREGGGLSGFLARENDSAVLRCRPDIDIAAGNGAPTGVVQCILFGVAAGLGIAGARRGGNRGHHARLAALDTAIDGNGYPGDSDEVQEYRYDS